MADDSITRLKNLSSIPTSSLSGSFTKLIILPIAAFVFGVTDTINAGAGVFSKPLNTLGTGLSDLAAAILGSGSTEGAADIISSGAAQSSADISVFGIAAFPLAIALVAVTGYIYSRFRSEESTSNVLPFGPDIPFVGDDEEGEE